MVSREKLTKLDSKRREYNIIVIGEEQYLAYNRVGLTSFFQHRKVENLYLNHEDWVTSLPLTLKRWSVFVDFCAGESSMLASPRR